MNENLDRAALRSFEQQIGEFALGVNHLAVDLEQLVSTLNSCEIETTAGDDVHDAEVFAERMIPTCGFANRIIDECARVNQKYSGLKPEPTTTLRAQRGQGVFDIEYSRPLLYVMTYSGGCHFRDRPMELFRCHLRRQRSTDAAPGAGERCSEPCSLDS